METYHFNRLRDAGCHLETFNESLWYEMEEINYRTHRKILVVDGAVGFTGGAGVADHWLGNADSPDHWRDTHLQVTGPVVAHLEAAFYENWLETGHASAPALDLPAPAVEPLAGSLVVRSSPTGGSNAVKLLYLLSIAGARQSIDLQSPYVVLDASTRYAIFEARKRGVRVRMLVEGQMTDAMPVKYAGRAAYDDLLSAGVRIAEYQPTMMHVKATVVDDVWSIVGSTNFDNRSFELNDEINVVIADRGIARRLLSDMDADWRQSREITLDAWRSRSITEKGRERFWSAFGELF
jgi:cardiolipin synthase